MSTPTFRARRPNGATDPLAVAPLDPTLAALGEGRVDDAVVARLSDLNRNDAAALAAVWPALPEATRIDVVRRIEGLVEERIDLEFGRALRIALDDESAVVRQLAVAALWEDGRADLLDRLRALLAGDPSQDVRAEAAKALGRFAEQAVAGELDPDEAAGVRRELLELAGDGAAPHGLRRRALEAVGVFGRESAVRGVIAAAYDDDDQGLRASAVFAMGRSLDRRWLDVLRDELGSSEAELRYEAARACGALGDDEVVPDLVPLTDDPDAEVRQAVIAAFGQLGGRSAVRVLRNLAEDADEADADAIEAALEEASGALETPRGER